MRGIFLLIFRDLGTSLTSSPSEGEAGSQLSGPWVLHRTALSVCLFILRLPCGLTVREEMPHLVSPGRGGDAHGCEQGGTVCVAELGPAPAPVPTPNPLNEIKLALPRGGREAGGGGRKGAGGGSPEPRPQGTATDLLCSTWRDTLCAEELVSPGGPSSLQGAWCVLEFRGPV